MSVLSYLSEVRNRFPKLKMLARLRSFCFVLALVFMPFGAIGGCGGGGTEPDVIAVGNHRQAALDDISGALNIGTSTQKPNNILLDGSSLKELTDGEETYVRESFDQGFIVVAYQLNAADTCYMFNQVLQHPLLCTTNKNRPESNMHEVYTVEQHDGVVWASAAQFGVTPPLLDVTIAQPGAQVFNPDTQSTPIPQTRQADDPLAGTGFLFHGVYMKEWIDAFQDRIAKFVLMSENKDEVATAICDATLGGTITNLAQAWIQTNSFTVGFDSSGNIHTAITAPGSTDIFQQTNEAWVVTEVMPNGLSSFLYVNQDMLLASSTR